jgi:hypothetical protein
MKTLESRAVEHRVAVERESRFRLTFLHQFLLALGQSLDPSSKNEIRELIEQVFSNIADTSLDSSEIERTRLLTI